MIVLVRHGRTEANARGLLLGRADPVLDAEGRRQAVCLGRAVADLDVARVVTSPLARCRATAAAVVDGLGPAAPAPEVDERWVELDYGVLDGMRLTDVPAASWAAWRADAGWTPEGGESLLALGARVREACAELAPQAAERDVVVVSHVSPVKAAVAWALGVGDEVAWRMWLAPASITRVGTAAGRPSLRSYNEVSHLG